MLPGSMVVVPKWKTLLLVIVTCDRGSRLGEAGLKGEVREAEVDRLPPLSRSTKWYVSWSIGRDSGGCKMFLCAADGWRVAILAYAMYVQASGRLKADVVCTILKALLAIRPDSQLHGSTICRRGKEQCGRSNLDLKVAVSEMARENCQPVLVGQGDQ